MTPTQELSIRAVLSSMKALGARHRPILVPLTLAFAVLSTALVPLQLDGTFGLAIALGLGLFLRAAYAGMLAALVCLPAELKTAGALWTAIRPVLTSLIWVTLVVVIGTGFGLVLLFIPGFILLTIWSVVVPVIVVERKGVFDGLSRSRELVRGNGWRVFSFLVCLFLITILLGFFGLFIARPFGTGMAAAMVGNFVLICVAFPLLLGGPAVLYNALTETAAEPAEPEEEPETGI